MENFNFSKTCIGSVPHEDANAVVKQIITSFKEIPFWPQMPKRSFLENMYAQYSEGLPGIVVNEKSKKILIDMKKDLSSDMEWVFKKFLDNDLESFSIKEKYAEGLHRFLDKKKVLQSNADIKYLKGQIIGPISFGLTIKDASGKSIIYFKEYEELIPKFLGMKAKWQVRRLKNIYDKVMIFIDEPYLASIGSSVVNIDKEKTKQAINEVSSMIKEEGGLSGLHCCGNTEWEYLLSLDIDILSFDAYNYMKEFLLYKDAIKNFLKRGKTIAWGIIPTSSVELKKTNSKTLIKKLTEAIASISSSASSIVTPSCGCGTMSVEECEKVFELLEEVSVELSGH